MCTRLLYSEAYLGGCVQCMGVSSLQEKESAEELNTEARRKLEDYKVPDVSQLVAVLLTITESGMPKSYTDLFMCVCACVSGNGVRQGEGQFARACQNCQGLGEEGGDSGGMVVCLSV